MSGHDKNKSKIDSGGAQGNEGGAANAQKVLTSSDVEPKSDQGGGKLDNRADKNENEKKKEKIGGGGCAEGHLGHGTVAQKVPASSEVEPLAGAGSGEQTKEENTKTPLSENSHRGELQGTSGSKTSGDKLGGSGQPDGEPSGHPLPNKPSSKPPRNKQDKSGIDTLPEKSSTKSNSKPLQTQSSSSNSPSSRPSAYPLPREFGSGGGTANFDVPTRPGSPTFGAFNFGANGSVQANESSLRSTINKDDGAKGEAPARDNTDVTRAHRDNAEPAAAREPNEDTDMVEHRVTDDSDEDHSVAAGSATPKGIEMTSPSVINRLSELRPGMPPALLYHRGFPGAAASGSVIMPPRTTRAGNSFVARLMETTDVADTDIEMSAVHTADAQNGGAETIHEATVDASGDITMDDDTPGTALTTDPTTNNEVQENHDTHQTNAGALADLEMHDGDLGTAASAEIIATNKESENVMEDDDAEGEHHLHQDSAVGSVGADSKTSVGDGACLPGNSEAVEDDEENKDDDSPEGGSSRSGITHGKHSLTNNNEDEEDVDAGFEALDQSGSSRDSAITVPNNMVDPNTPTASNSHGTDNFTNGSESSDTIPSLQSRHAVPALTTQFDRSSRSGDRLAPVWRGAHRRYPSSINVEGQGPHSAASSRHTPNPANAPQAWSTSHTTRRDLARIQAEIDDGVHDNATVNPYHAALQRLAASRPLDAAGHADSPIDLTLDDDDEEKEEQGLARASTRDKGKGKARATETPAATSQAELEDAQDAGAANLRFARHGRELEKQKKLSEGLANLNNSSGRLPTRNSVRGRTLRSLADPVPRELVSSVDPPPEILERGVVRPDLRVASDEFTSQHSGSFQHTARQTNCPDDRASSNASLYAVTTRNPSTNDIAESRGEDGPLARVSNNPSLYAVTTTSSSSNDTRDSQDGDGPVARVKRSRRESLMYEFPRNSTKGDDDYEEDAKAEESTYESDSDDEGDIRPNVHAQQTIGHVAGDRTVVRSGPMMGTFASNTVFDARRNTPSDFSGPMPRSVGSARGSVSTRSDPVGRPTQRRQTTAAPQPARHSGLRRGAAVDDVDMADAPSSILASRQQFGSSPGGGGREVIDLTGDGPEPELQPHRTAPVAHVRNPGYGNAGQAARTIPAGPGHRSPHNLPPYQPDAQSAFLLPAEHPIINARPARHLSNGSQQLRIPQPQADHIRPLHDPNPRVAFVRAPPSTSFDAHLLLNGLPIFDINPAIHANPPGHPSDDPNMYTSDYFTFPGLICTTDLHVKPALRYANLEHTYHLKKATSELLVVHVVSSDECGARQRGRKVWGLAMHHALEKDPSKRKQGEEGKTQKQAPSGVQDIAVNVGQTGSSSTVTEQAQRANSGEQHRANNAGDSTQTSTPSKGESSAINATTTAVVLFNKVQDTQAVRTPPSAPPAPTQDPIQGLVNPTDQARRSTSRRNNNDSQNNREWSITTIDSYQPNDPLSVVDTHAVGLALALRLARNYIISPEARAMRARAAASDNNTTNNELPRRIILLTPCLPLLQIISTAQYLYSQGLPPPGYRLQFPRGIRSIIDLACELTFVHGYHVVLHWCPVHDMRAGTLVQFRGRTTNGVVGEDGEVVRGMERMEGAPWKGWKCAAGAIIKVFRGER